MYIIALRHQSWISTSVARLHVARLWLQYAHAKASATNYFRVA